MATNEEIIEQAQYYIDNNVSMKEAGEHFGVSKKTFQIRMKKLEDISPSVFKLVQDKKEKNLVSGAIRGGQNGKPNTVSGTSPKPRSHSISPEEAINLANYMLENDATLRDLEATFGISKSTIFDNFTKEILGEELNEKIEFLLESHKPEHRLKK